MRFSSNAGIRWEFHRSTLSVVSFLKKRQTQQQQRRQQMKGILTLNLGIFLSIFTLLLLFGFWRICSLAPNTFPPPSTHARFSEVFLFSLTVAARFASSSPSLSGRRCERLLCAEAKQMTDNNNTTKTRIERQRGTNTNNEQSEITPKTQCARVVINVEQHCRRLRPLRNSCGKLQRKQL